MMKETQEDNATQFNHSVQLETINKQNNFTPFAKHNTATVEIGTAINTISTNIWNDTKSNVLAKIITDNKPELMTGNQDNIIIKASTPSHMKQRRKRLRRQYPRDNSKKQTFSKCQ